MSVFGLTLLPDQGQAPEGFVAASVALGEHEEATLMSTKRWSKNDYLQHWMEAAKAALKGEQPTLFCDDFELESCSCFVGWRVGQEFIFEQWIFRMEDVRADGRLLRLRGEADMSRDVSQWRVPVAAIRSFANS
jgi:hypothetical protein